MTKLSWIIYLVDIVSNIGICAAIFLIFGAITMGITTVVVSAEADEMRLPPAKWFVIYLAVVVVAVLIPSKQTIVLIAASEYGQQIAATQPVTETANKAIKLLNKYLDDALVTGDKNKK